MGSTPNPFTWNGAYGYEFIPFTGLYHVGAREYDPRTARWLQRDPIDVSSGHPNLYVYCANDPINFMDRIGDQSTQKQDKSGSGTKKQKPRKSPPPPLSLVQLPAQGVGYFVREETVRSGYLWGTQEMIDCIEAVGEAFYLWTGLMTGTPGCFRVGDISKKGGGDIPGHKSHEKGIDVDIYLLTPNLTSPQGLTVSSKQYSRQWTGDLIGFFVALCDVDIIFFNDVKLQKVLKKEFKRAVMISWPNHDNHFHVRLKQRQQTSGKKCK